LASGFWAIEPAMHFYNSPSQVKETCIERIMKQSAEKFNHAATARRDIELYEKMLQRPLVCPARRVSLHAEKKVPETASAAFENFSRRSKRFIQGHVEALASGFRQMRGPQRKEVLKCWLGRKKEQTKDHMRASLRMRL
jgi:hypothetical protein